MIENYIIYRYYLVMMRMGDMFKTLLKVTLLKVCVLTGTYHITYVEAAAPVI